MKKALFVIVAITLVACSKQKLSEQAPSKLNKQEIRHTVRSYDEALKIAENAIDMLESSKSSTRSKEKCRKIDFTQNKVIMRDTKTRGDSITSDSLIYVFNFENNEGFALVSASKNTEGLLAVTEQGHCDPDVPSGIDGFDMFVNMAKDYVLYGKMSPRSFEEIKDSIIDIISYTEIGPYIPVNWGQNCAEGEYCRNGKAGCTNVAMAQIMAYYCHPDTIHLSYSGGSVLNLNWTNIRNHGTTHFANQCVDNTTHSSISHLLRELGKRNRSYYYLASETYDGQARTVTDTLHVRPTFQGLGFTVGTFSSYNILNTRNTLDNQTPLLINGYTSNGVGHTWVIDGYMIENCIAYEMIKYGDGDWQFTGYSYPTTRYLVHFNWGWYGANNGYFLEGIFDSGNAVHYDNTNYYQYNLGYYVETLSVGLN